VKAGTPLNERLTNGALATSGQGSIEVIVAWNDQPTFETGFRQSRGLDGPLLTLIDNRRGNEGFPTIFNRRKRLSNADWLVFCRQDASFLSPDWMEIISQLEPTACYGVLGVTVDGHHKGQIWHPDGSVEGQAAAGVEVQTLDEVCLIVPRRIYSIIDFDERLKFHLYAADYCLEASRKGFGSRIAGIRCQCHTQAAIGEPNTPEYREAKQIFLQKHADSIPLCTTAFKVLPKYWDSIENNETLRTEYGFIKGGSKVLEIGAAAGFMTRALVRAGCAVTVIEIDEPSARAVAALCRDVIVGDVETLDLQAALKGERFDTIVLGDVIEHLREPAAVLKALRRLLAEAGNLVVSIPNVAHAAVRLNLLDGHFTYRRNGLLDATHLRLYTLASIVGLFADCGYSIHDLHRTRKGFLDTEIPVNFDRATPQLLRRLCRDSEATTYQFVFRAVPADVVAGRSVAEFVDSSWSAEQAIGDLARALSDRGRQSFSCNPPDYAVSRVWFRRAFGVQRNTKTLVYIVVLTVVPHAVLRFLGSFYQRYQRAGSRLPAPIRKRRA
jgi:2-polyprenyl-3-methyl-5-hydroxy-6-metoxy-1,4-benzoquinol methylase